MKKSLMFTGLFLLMTLMSPKIFAANEIIVGDVEIKQEQDVNNPSVINAYLYVPLKNTGKNEVYNLTVVVTYFTKDDFQISKAVIPKALTESIPGEQEKKFKIYLGDNNPINPRAESHNYPFDQLSTLDHFKVEVTDLQMDFLEKAVNAIAGAGK